MGDDGAHPFETIWQQATDWALAPLTPVSPWSLMLGVGIIMAATILWSFALAHMIAAVETL